MTGSHYQNLDSTVAVLPAASVRLCCNGLTKFRSEGDLRWFKHDRAEVFWQMLDEAHCWQLWDQPCWSIWGWHRRGLPKNLTAPCRFGDLEPLVCELQETPVERLQSTLAKKLQGGLPLKTLVAAGALANARTFGGEDYIGFHTFMALGPALKMSALMPKGSEALACF